MAAQNAPMTVNVAVEVRLPILPVTNTPMPHFVLIPDKLGRAAAIVAGYS